MQNHQFQTLFDQVNALLTRYRKFNEITGEKFNVFQILKLESSEVRMHSAFIGELLNPRGSHGQKDIFLKLFVDAFCFKGIIIDTASCQVEIEKHAGFINEDRTEGGRIDIFISDKNNNHIIIENKIYAGDQHNQLVRYHNHSQNADILYLTLDGSPPSEQSAVHLKEDEDFRCISYKMNIIDWLEACRKEVTILPLIREAISHYINLIKFLTNQTTNHNMAQELTDLMKTNLEASFSVAGNLDTTMQQIADAFGEKVIATFTSMGFNCKYSIDFSENYTGIWITKEDWDYIRIGYQFHAKNRSMIYGLTINGVEDGSKPMQIPESLANDLRTLPNNEKRNDDWWPWFNNMEEPFKDWNRYEAYEAIFDGRMVKMLVEKTNILLKMTEGIKL